MPVDAMKPFKPANNVAYTATAGQSNAFHAQTTVVRVVATSACYIKFGSNPTATTSDHYLPADWVEYFKVTGGDKVSAVQASAGGTLSVTEMTN